MYLYNRGVSFGKNHSRDNWGVIMTNKVIEYPQPITDTVSVNGRDGVIDLSTVLTGDIKYKNRKLKIDLDVISEDGQIMRPLSRIANDVQGQTLKIIFDEDPDFYYIGRCTMTSKIDGTVAKVTITVDADPYKYLIYESTQISQFTGEHIVTYVNMRKRATPTFIVKGGDLEINFNGLKTVINEGTHIIPSLVFVDGENIIKYKAEQLTTVTVNWQEARL